MAAAGICLWGVSWHVASGAPVDPGGGSSRSAAKTSSLESVYRHAPELIQLSDQVWSFAETALREHESARVLADYAQKQGFVVERGVAQMPTAFLASYGSGRPVIAVMGEYDALPGLTQQAVPFQQPVANGAAGHGCGHNLFGVASLGAALAIKEQIRSGRLHGTVRFYGTPAEEDIGGKIYMARAGLFSDVDVMLAWHPWDANQADTTSSQALMRLEVEFHGKTAHAALDPWNGRSALHALELFAHGVNAMREQIKETSRMQYVVSNGGEVPNVIPDHTQLKLWLRDWKRSEVEDLRLRVQRLAEGAAMMTETKAEVRLVGGNWELLLNMTGERLVDRNLRALEPVHYTEEEQNFARRLQRAVGVAETGMDTTIRPFAGQSLEGGSTDVGDVSWVVPILHMKIATAPKNVPWHAWPVVAASGMSIGHKGLLQASRALAATMVDLYEQPAVLDEIRAEFLRMKGDVVFKPYLPDGPPPIPP